MAPFRDLCKEGTVDHRPSAQRRESKDRTDGQPSEPCQHSRQRAKSPFHFGLIVGTTRSLVNAIRHRLRKRKNRPDEGLQQWLQAFR
jgi:hypothetical protein